MKKLIYICGITLISTLIASAGGALQPLQHLIAGPLGKTSSGRLVCGASNRIPSAPAGVQLTIRNAAGIEVATQLFNNVEQGDTVELELGPGPRGAYTCLAESDSAQINLTLTHKDALQRATASVVGADALATAPTMTRPNARSQAGPVGPGIGYKVVCRGTTKSTQMLTASVLDQNGTVVPGGEVTKNVPARGIIEVQVNAAFGVDYFCVVVGSASGIIVNATIEAKSPLGEPSAAAGDSVFQIED